MLQPIFQFARGGGHLVPGGGGQQEIQKHLSTSISNKHLVLYSFYSYYRFVKFKIPREGPSGNTNNQSTQFIT